MTDLEKILAEKNGTLDSAYSDLIVKYVREEYTLNDELALQRQRDEKVEEFQRYYAYVEECKQRAYREIYGENK